MRFDSEGTKASAAGGHESTKCLRAPWLIMVLAAATALAGCARTVLESSVVDQWPTYEENLDYWEALETQRILTVNDVLHGLLLLTDGTDVHVTYEGRLEDARQRGWVSPDAAPAPNESATVGMVAVASCEILAIKGGLTMRVFGPSPRYCTRELVFLEIIPPRTENQSLSGLEFIDLVGRLEDEIGDTMGPGARSDEED